MRTLPLAAAALLVFPASACLAQADANLAPGGIVDGAKATVNAAAGTAPDGRPNPGGTGEGRQAGTSGSKMVEQGDAGARPPEAAEPSNKP